MSLKHKKNSGKADGNDATLIQPSDWNADHAVDAGGVDIATSDTDPGSPTAGSARLYAKSRGSRDDMRLRSSNGREYVFQPSFLSKTILAIAPGSGATPTVFGGGYSSLGTVTHPAPTAGSFGSYWMHTSAATANTIVGIENQIAPYSLNTTATSGGGFSVTQQVLWPDASYGSGAGSGIRFFVGVTSAQNGSTVSSDSISGISKIGFAFSHSLADTDIMIVASNGTAESRISTGCLWEPQRMYVLSLYATPGTGSVTWRIENLFNGSIFTGSISTNLPAVTTFMRNAGHMIVLSATARNMRFKRVYCEQDG